jgi:hypothetical protein
LGGKGVSILPVYDPEQPYQPDPVAFSTLLVLEDEDQCDQTRLSQPSIGAWISLIKYFKFNLVLFREKAHNVQHDKFGHSVW